MLKKLDSFGSEEERSLDELKTKLLKQYKSKKKLKRLRRRLRPANFVKSVDFLIGNEKLPRLDQSVATGFSRKSTGVSRNSIQKMSKFKMKYKDKLAMSKNLQLKLLYQIFQATLFY